MRIGTQPTRWLILLGGTLLAGCTSLEIKDLDQWQPVNLVTTDHPPTPEQIAATGQRTKVVVSQFKEPSNRRLAQEASLSTALTAGVESYLTDAGVQLVSRDNAQTLLDEVAVAETTGQSGRYQGPEVASFAVMGRIDSVDIHSEFTAGYQVKTKEGTKRVPSSCRYTANMSGTLQIYAIPELQMARNITFSGSDSNSEESYNCSDSMSKYMALIRSAGESGLRSGRVALQNHFAPKGYVVDMRTNGDNAYLVRVMLGSDRGLKKGSKIEFFASKESYNPLTQQSSREDQKIAVGLVTDQISSDTAWILLDKPEMAQKIKLGDFVKVSFERGFFGDLFNF